MTSTTRVSSRADDLLEVEALVRQSLLNEFGSMMLYARLADRASSGEARGVLRMLSAAEELHIGRLTDLVAVFGADGESALAKVAFVRALREEADKRLEGQLADAGITERSSPNDLLAFAKSAEERAGGHYARLAELTDEQRLKEFFLTLVEEEASHAAQLDHVQELLAVSSR